MPYRLIAQTGHSIELEPRPMVVGSDPAVEIPILATMRLAPQHFRVEPHGETHKVELLAAKDILAVNGMPVRDAVLASGDVIHAGDLELVYRVHGDAGEPPPLPLPQDESSGGKSGFRLPEPRALAVVDEDAEVLEGSPQFTRSMARTGWSQELLAQRIAQEDLHEGIFMGLLAALLAAVAWAYAAQLNFGTPGAMAQFVLYLLLSLWLGNVVRRTGKGASITFGYAGAGVAVFSGLLGSYLAVYLMGVSSLFLNAPTSGLDWPTWAQKVVAATEARASGVVDLSSMMEAKSLVAYGMAAMAGFRGGNGAAEG
jgi:hypothetical protein